MRISCTIVILAYICSAHCFTKYGRTCKDIGCPSNQICVMETDPCSYYQRQGECGSYPACKKTSNTARSCSTYVCPPTKICKMDGETPKCVDDHSKVGHIGYDTQSQSISSASGSSSSGNVYPSLPRGETTPRPNIHHQPVSGGGYQGGQIGSGYPGQTRPGTYPQQGYPQQAGGYPQRPGGYPQQVGGYPQQPNSWYPQQGGYNPSYPNYQGGQANQYPGYNPQGGNQRYGSNSSPSWSDQITNSIKSIGGYFKKLGSYFG